jgi:hypothetical protein
VTARTRRIAAWAPGVLARMMWRNEGIGGPRCPPVTVRRQDAGTGGDYLAVQPPVSSN